MKSVNKFKTINQVAKHINLPQHVLRFWEVKFKQLTPLKLSGNRRYYRDIDIELIVYIKNLLHEDCISIKGVQKIFGNQSINKILRTKNPVLKKKNLLNDNKDIKKNNLDNESLNFKKELKEIVSDLRAIKNSL